MKRKYRRQYEFDIQINENIFRKGDIIKACHVHEVVTAKVIKVYDFVWWRRILIHFKFIKNSCKLKVTTYGR